MTGPSRLKCPRIFLHIYLLISEMLFSVNILSNAWLRLAGWDDDESDGDEVAVDVGGGT